MFNPYHFFALLGSEDKGLNYTKFSIDASDRRHIIFIGDGLWRKAENMYPFPCADRTIKGGGGTWGTSF